MASVSELALSILRSHFMAKSRFGRKFSLSPQRDRIGKFLFPLSPQRATMGAAIAFDLV